MEGHVGEIKPVGDQPSRNSGQTGLEPEEHTIDIVEISDEDWIKSLRTTAGESTQYQSQWPRIPKVPQILRGTKDFKKFYEPRVISIGPYHHGKPNLHPGEMIKLPCAQKFLDDSKQDIKALYAKIRRNIEAVKKCYDWSSTKNYGDQKLARMMLLDGCFLLQFIRRKGMRKFLRNHQISFVEEDLFLLENQLPYGVLKLIFEGANFQGGLPMEKKIKKFIRVIGMPEGLSSEIQLEEVNEEPSHLLDLLRSSLLGQSQPEQEQQPEKKGKSSSSQGGKGGLCCRWKKGKQRGIWQSFRHIKELKAAGIYLKPSRTCFLRDVSFKSYFFFGYLKLPPITIDDFTKPMFMNMVAYEMCPDAPDDYAVTSYICFLEDLIDHADDVKELRSKHILRNLLGSDEDVAQIFNEIGNGLVDPGIYKGVKDRIQKHYDKRVNTWIAQALHDHFSTPWTIMAFTAAVLILFLTGVQTYYALPGN
ncbi:hypothetical protein PVL29_018016 [Vitis rotundifolia]|uniref:Uncharacterized protein n=1 Tax=Vitis rotundifolia TaxID=103349 RepID=A0AA39DFL6_VITRO|nr:hypothetical protein PVL29_018016 [Vitis rotundifolia]